MDKDKFTAKDIVAQVDLSGYGEGQFKVPVTVDLRDRLTNIKVTNHEPKEILFTFEKLVTKDMPITINTTGDLAENYVLGDISTRSQTIQIKGPRSWVNEVADIVAEVKLDGRRATDNIIVPVKLLDDVGNEVRGVTKEPSSIDIHIPIYRTRRLPIELQTQGELPENFVISEISVIPSTIVIKGSDDIVNLTKIDTKLVDINNLVGREAAEVDLALPENVTLLNPEEKVFISYTIEEIITKDLTYTVGDIDILNLDEELTLEEEDFDKIVQISLRGIQSALDGIDEETFKPSIDLEGLGEGRHEVSINLGNIQGVTTESVNPEVLVINIKKK